MAWYNGTFSCGCEGKVNVIGPQKERQWKIDRAFEKVCPECYEKYLEKERLRKNKEAAEKAKEMELPELRGTEKQIAWANTLRQDFINKISKFIEEEKDEDSWYYLKKQYNLKKLALIEDILIVRDYILENKTESKYYIDNRDRNFLRLIEIDIDNAIKTDEENIQEQHEKEVKLESTVFPQEAVTNVAAEITVADDKISVRFEKNEKFRTLVKELGYKWDGIWIKNINELTGSAEDRAAELGNKLLNKGFPIMILDESIRNNAINGIYETECNRWITLRIKGDYKGRLAIRWFDKSDLYNKARKLPGSKWDNPAVIVRIEHYKEVEEFAELYDFNFTKKAKEAVNDYLKSIENIEIVNPIKVEAQASKDGLKDILDSSREVLNDLKEDD